MIFFSSMATIVASIEDLVYDILLLLPVKSVLRFKCVSKQWFALISEPKFCHSHTLHLYSNSYVFPSALLLAPHSSPTCQVIPLRIDDVSGSSNFHDVKVPTGTVIQSCNGLVLIQRNSLQRFSEVEYFICNPTTNKSAPVIFPNQQFSSSVVSLFICFEPLKSPHYKLASIRYTMDSGYVLDVYSSETSSWSEPGFSFGFLNLPLQCKTIYFNGALYWYRSSRRTCFYLDLETQNFETCQLPVLNEFRYFGCAGGVLDFVLDSRFDFKLHILEWDDVFSEWPVRLNLDLLESSHQPLMFFPHFVIKDEDDDEQTCSFIKNGDIMSYNREDCKFKDRSNLKNGTQYFVYQHYENLSWVGPTKNFG